jgi:tetratricopeptide (TPR) repeat protein
MAMTFPMPERAFVGRVAEVGRLGDSLSRAASGHGSAVVISGEPGIGKSTLVAEAVVRAKAMGFNVSSGAASKDSMRPFLVFSGALSTLTEEQLFEPDERAGFSSVFALDASTGQVVAKAAKVGREGISAEIFSGMLSAVQSFIGDSFKEGEGSLGRLEQGDSKILIERACGLSIAAIIEGTDSPEMRAAVKGAADEILREPDSIQAALDTLAGKRFTVRKSLEGMKLESERLRIANRILDVLQASAVRKPLFVVLEDIQWADESSLFALRYVARNIAGSKILLLATARPSEGAGCEKTVAAMKEDGSVKEIALTGLDLAGVRGMVDSALPGNDLPAAFHERLHSDCAGNPFFISELLRQMLADGAIALDGGKYRMARDDYTMPSSVGQVVSRRLESLDEDAMALAEYASCVGREFPTSVALSAPSLEYPAASLEKLAAAGIVTVEGEASEFSHALFQAAVYDSLAPRWRSAHHRSIGEHYEAAHASRIDDVLYELARHFTKANEPAKAVAYSVRAAARAESSLAVEQAIAFYEGAIAMALGRASLTGSLAGVRERLGDLYALAGKHPEAIAAYESEFASTCEARFRARLKRKTAEVHIKVGEFPKAEADCKAGVEALAGEHCGEEARIICVLGGMCDKTGDYDRGIALLKEGMALAEKLGDRVELAHALHGLGGLYLSRSRFPEAIECLSKALEIRRGLGAQMDVSKTLNNLGVAHWYVGDLDKALVALGESLDIKEKHGDKQGIATAYSNLGMIRRNKGDLAMALDYHRRSLEMKRKMGDKYGIGNSLHNIGVTCEDLGDWDGALASHNEGLELRAKIGDKNGVANSYNSIGLVYGLMGHLEKALEYQRESLELATQIDYKRIIIHSRLGIANADMDLGRMDEAWEMVGKALEMAVAIGAKREEAMSRQAVGAVLRLRRDLSGARVELDKAEALLRASDAKSTLAVMLCEKEALLKASGDSAGARAALTEALGLFESSGMRHWVGKCRKSKEGLV